MTTFNEQQAAVHEMVRREWTDHHTVAAWRKWAPAMFIQSRAATESIVRAVAIRPGLHVLDIASGTGEPALTLAEAVGAGGHVTATDLGSEMLAVAAEHARGRGLTNLTFQPADVHELPFGDGSFDRVTCRFGVMYFANVPRALAEIRRVLKPGGRVAFIAWGSPDQPYMRSTVNVLFGHLPAPPPPPGPDAPTPFRFAQPGTLSAALAAAGFTGVDEQQLESPFPWPGPAEQLCEHFFAAAAPFRPLLESLGAEKARAVLADVVQALRTYEKDGEIQMNAKLVLASAAR